jgi:hypothetical protein
MANTRRKRDGKRGSGRKPAPTKDLGSTTAAAVADLTPEPNSPIALASEAFAREEATAAAVAVLEAAMQAQSVEAAPEAAPVAVEAPLAEVRDRAGPHVRVKVSSGEVRSLSSQKKSIEAEPSEVKVSRWLRDVSEPKPVVPVVVAAPARPRPSEGSPPGLRRPSTKRVVIPTYVDQPTRRSTTWLWVFAAATALVTWIMLDRPSNEHRLAASAAPAAPIAERAPTPSARPMAKTSAPIERTVVARAPEVAPGQPPKVAPVVSRPKVAKVAPPEVIVAPEVVVTPEVVAPPEPVHVTPEILALAERISADEPPAVVRKGPLRRVSAPPRVAGKAVNWYDEVPPKAAAYEPRDYDDVMPLSGMRASDDESLSRGRQYDHVPPRAALD